MVGMPKDSGYVRLPTDSSSRPSSPVNQPPGSGYNLPSPTHAVSAATSGQDTGVRRLVSFFRKPSEQKTASSEGMAVAASEEKATAATAFAKGDASGIYKYRAHMPPSIWCGNVDAALEHASKLDPKEAAEVFAEVGGSLIDAINAAQPEGASTTRGDEPGQDQAGEADRLVALGALNLSGNNERQVRSDAKLARVLMSLALGSFARPEINMFDPKFEKIMRLFTAPVDANEQEQVHKENARKEAAKILSKMPRDDSFKAWPIWYAKAGEANLDDLSRFRAAKPLGLAGEHFQGRGNWGQAKELYKRASETLGPVELIGEPAEVGVGILGNLARVYKELARPKSAEKVFKLALKTAAHPADPERRSLEPILPPNHPTVLDIKHDFAKFYMEKGRYDYATTLLKDAIQAAEESGVQNAKGEPAALEYKLTLATLYATQDRHQEAEDLFKQVMDQKMQASGLDRAPPQTD